MYASSKCSRDLEPSLVDILKSIKISQACSINVQQNLENSDSDFSSTRLFEINLGHNGFREYGLFMNYTIYKYICLFA